MKLFALAVLLFSAAALSAQTVQVPYSGHPLPTFALLAQLAAFPGAQGGGAVSVGGRGGVVMEVTNGNDSGTGSLRSCVQASGPRNCVFRVAGLVNITSGDNLASNPYLTIDCQSAPGEVIIGGPKSNGAALRISTHDVVVRYCVFSPDNASTPSGPDTGTVGVTIVNCAQPKGSSTTFPFSPNTGCFNIVVDHNTTRWNGNKGIITTSNFTPGGANGTGDGPNHNISVQWNLYYEPHEGHPVGPGTATDETCVGTKSGNCLSPLEVNIDFHHSMFVDINHRIPENSNGSTRWVNNIVWNYGFYGNAWLGAEIIDAINNKYSSGPLGVTNGAQKYPIHFTTNSPEMSGAPSAYVAGNVLGGYGVNTPATDQYGTLVNQITGENGTETGPIPPSWERTAPMPNTQFPITADPAANLDSELTTGVGAFQHLDCNGNWVNSQDPQDARIIAQYKSGSKGGFWPNGVTFTGQPTPSPVLAAWTDTPVINGTACVESLHDGIPDQWKVANKLSTTDPTVYKTPSPSGYTWLEVYMNGSGVTPPPNPPSPNNTTVPATPPATNTSIVDAAGNTWTLNTTQVSDPTCNGGKGGVCGTQVVLNGAAQTTTAASLLLYWNGVVYSQNTVPLWWNWVNGAWVKTSGDPRPPITHPTVTCTPTSVQVGGTVTCTANQPITTWSVTAGTITQAGVITAPTTAQTITATGTNANGSGSVPITVTAAPPSTFQLNCTVGANNAIACTGTMP
jgi:pectate lyase